ESLESARFGFADTGLTEEELPINVVVWRKKLPSAPGALDAVVRAIGASMPVLIQYTSLNRGDLGKWRRILPLCLECVDGQWRVCAQDLDKSDAPLRTFGLTRIVDFRGDVDPVPRSVIRHNPRDSMARLRVQIDRRMTPSQCRAIEVEFGVRNGTVLVPSRGIHEFKRHFVQGSLPSDDAIWPPFESAELP
ncbi:MAG: hypothetical protein KGM91_10165, partial [Burkholderiales bacterium]|nr:hypothetical protein [Burkholderiales bacterium]